MNEESAIDLDHHTLEAVDIYARQGDLMINTCNAAPVALRRQDTPITIAGSHEGAHSLPAGVGYARLGREHYVLPEEDVQLRHGSRHRPVELRAGQVYRIWPQIERHGDGDQDVED